MRKVFPIIESSHSITSGSERRLINFAPLAINLSAAPPDYYSGARSSQVSRQVRKDLGPYIMPSEKHPSPLLRTSSRK